MTFPGGTHDLWIRYWLAAGGIDPDKDVSTIVVPPPQMVANMKVGNMDAFCVGEPWNEQLVNQDIGFTAATTGEIWFKHPEKILGMRADWVDANPKATLRHPDGDDGGAAVVREGGEQGRRWPRSSAAASGSTCRCPTSSAASRATSTTAAAAVEKGTNLLHEVLGREGRGLLSLEEPRHLVRHREHPLGQVRADDRHQGAGRQDQPLRPVARGGQGARPRRHADRRQPRRREVLRRQGVRSGRSDGLPEVAVDQARAWSERVARHRQTSRRSRR